MANRWFVTVDIIAKSARAVEINKTRMDWSPASCSPMNHAGGTARTGEGLAASGGLIQKIGACPGHVEDPGSVGDPGKWIP
jgi:hypothetical protein